MRGYIIMTDSCCDLNAQEVQELELTVLPLTFRMDGVDYQDTPDHAALSPQEFFHRVANGAECSTSAVSVGTYMDAMRSVLESGRDILCICFSGALSATYQSACIAADDLREEYPDATIEVIDSLSASRGMGMLVWQAVQRKKQGASLPELAEYVRELIPHQCHWFTVADLHHLKRGGRISAATAVVGTMLQVKPIMHEDKEGRLTARGKARGMKAALTALVDQMEELAIPPLSHQTVFICHADCPEYVEFVSKLIHDRFGITDIRSDYIGPVIGSHTGCGTLALFFMGTQR